MNPLTESHRSALELSQLRDSTFFNESNEYALARTKLLEEEIHLRRMMGKVAQMRRDLPPGPVIEKDYRFLNSDGKELGLKDLFEGKDTLVVYFWMYGPERERPCPMCTNWLGGVEGNAQDIEQRVTLKIFGRSPVSRQLEFARERNWKNLKFLQTLGDEFAQDFHTIIDGNEVPGLFVFKRDGDKIRLFYRSEMPADAADPGEDPRVAPDIAPLWNILDLTPEGRGKDWYPQLNYH